MSTKKKEIESGPSSLHGEESRSQKETIAQVCTAHGLSQEQRKVIEVVFELISETEEDIKTKQDSNE